MMKSLSSCIKKDEGDIPAKPKKKKSGHGWYIYMVGAILGYIPLYPTISAFFHYTIETKSS